MMSRRQVLRSAAALTAAAGLPVLAGCSGGSTRSGPTTPGTAPVAVGVQRTPVPISSAPDLAAVLRGMCDYAAALRATAAPTANWVVSPLSMDVAFGMARAGARGRTATQMDTVFGFPATRVAEGSPHEALNSLSAALTGGGDPEVSIANGLFVDRTWESKIARAYLLLLARQYGTSAQLVSFGSPDAAAVINDWVARQTHGRITKLFDKLDPDAAMVLANAVYLKASWAAKFDRHDTVPASFETGRRAVQTSMMHQTGRLKYGVTPAWARVTLPYLGGKLTMRLVLPGQSGAGPLAAAMSAAIGATASDNPTVVSLAVPTWKATTELSLKNPLSRMGMPLAFSDDADFTGMAPGLRIAQAVHRATITVTEDGTEAAAATGVELEPTAAQAAGVQLALNRPFAWAIVHEPTGAPVFVGQVVDPTAG